MADGVRCDVSDEESCAAAVATVLERHGRLDVLANVAGIGIARTLATLAPDEWRQVIDVNLTGTFLLSQAPLPALLESTGDIVNMASVAGLRATPYNAAYCASKGGVIMLTKSMAIELAKAGVRVNAVCPASVDTPFLRGFEIPEGADMSLFARAASPMGRLIDPAEVAAGRRLPGLRRGRPPSAGPPWSSTGPLPPDIGQRHRLGVPSRPQDPPGSRRR